MWKLAQLWKREAPFEQSQSDAADEGAPLTSDTPAEEGPHILKLKGESERLLKNELGWGQSYALWVIMLFFATQLTVPFTISVYMVRDFGDGRYSEQVVGQLTGILAASSSFARTFTAYIWGLASDRLGRKVVVLIGNVAIMVSLLGYGSSSSFLSALLWRLVPSAFIGSPVAIKSMMGEAYTQEGQARAMSLFNLGIGLGSVLAPILGGTLSKPCDTYEGFPFCKRGQLFELKPYLLPCLATCLIGLLALISNLLLLEETHPDVVAAPGGWWGHLLRVLSCKPSSRPYKESRDASQDQIEGESLLEISAKADVEMGTIVPLTVPDEDAFVIESNTAAEVGTSEASSEEPESMSPPPPQEKQRSNLLRQFDSASSARDLLQGSKAEAKEKTVVEDEEQSALLSASSTAAKEIGSSGNTHSSYRWWKDANVRLNIIASGSVAFLFCLMDELVPIFVSAPIGQGGLGMRLEEFTVALAVGGVVLVIFSLAIYPTLVRRFGSLTLCHVGLWGGIPSAIMVPLSSLFVKSNILKQAMLIASMTAKNMAMTLALNSSLILINVVAPKKSMGAVNGAAMTLQSGGRALGPLLSGSLWALVVSLHFLGQQYVAFVLLTVGFAGCSWMYSGIRLPG